MSQLNKIENKLLEMEAGRFQMLCNEILTKLNYGNVTNSGGQIGTDKTIKGTPDSYILLNTGKFIFIEYSVAQKSLTSKFKDDILKCFDQEKTKVQIKEIEMIILMYNSVLAVGEVNTLNKICMDHNVKFRKYDISNIALLLQDKFPYLAEEYFQLEMSTGQFLDKSLFIKNSKKALLSTPLDIELKGRDDELSNLISLIEEQKFVLIAGKSGVGKTRLGIESIEKFSNKHVHFTPWYVRDIGAGLYRDLIRYTQYGKHIVFIDDINKLTSIESVLEYLSENKDRIKLVATVRDYALNSTVSKAKQFIIPDIIAVESLEDKYIEEICKSEYGIHNNAYLNRITKLSKGNPRIAVMMAIIAAKENSLKSISNISELLEVYYSDISRKLSDADDDNILKVLGVISFHDKLHLEDASTLEEISKLLKINVSEIKNCVDMLFRMELVDIYEDEVVRISDQILSVFVFHYVYEVRKTIRYDEVFKLYFPKYTQRIIQNINSITTYYGNIDFFVECIDLVWQEWKMCRHDNFHRLVLTCWFVRELETVTYIKSSFEGLVVQPETLDDYVLERNFNEKISDEIQALCYISSSEHYEYALDLILLYLEKCKGDIKNISSALIRHFGYTKSSYYQGYQIQFTLIEKIIKLFESNDIVWYQLFVNIAIHLLQYDFEYTESNDGKSFSFTQMAVVNVGKMKEIRALIWDVISDLLVNDNLKPYALNILKELKFGRFIGRESALYESDFDQIKSKVLSSINSSHFHDLTILDSLEKNVFYHIGLSFELEQISNSKEFLQYRVLRKSYFELSKDYDEGRREKRVLLSNYIENYDYIDFLELFKTCRVIESMSIDKYEISESLITIIDLVADDSVEVLLKAFIDTDTPILIDPSRLIAKFIEVHGKKRMLEILDQSDFKLKEFWYYSYYSVLKIENISQSDYDLLISHFDRFNKITSVYIRRIDFLENYKSFNNDIYPYFTSKIISKADKEMNRIFFNFLFSRDESDLKLLTQNFSSSHKLLIDVYLLMLGDSDFNDYNGNVFRHLYKLDVDLILKVCEVIFKENEYISRHNINFDFSVLWEMAYEQIEQVFDFVIERYCDRYFGDNFEVLFKAYGNRVTDEANQDSILKKYIRRYNNDIEKMEIIYSAIGNLSVARRVELIVYFIEVNKSFETFTKLPMRKKVEGWSGSEVPYVENKISFYKLIDKRINSFELLEHKEYIHSKIQNLERSIKEIRIREFLRDY